MPFRCPTCGIILSENYQCTNGHQFLIKEGVLKLMDEEFGQELESWLECFEDFRTPEFNTSDFSSLPYSGLKINKNIWQARRLDLQIIDRLISNNYQTTLDIGSWVGWLSNHLGKKGLDVMAIDYFFHHLDGLAARKYYENAKWISVQMNLEELDIIDEKFDIIVINRCFSYFTDTAKLISNTRRMLNPSGKIVITGLNLKRQNNSEAEELVEAGRRFKEKYNKELKFKPFKGCIENKDLEKLASEGFEICLYPGLKNKIKLFFFPTRVVTYYAVFNKSGGF